MNKQTEKLNQLEYVIGALAQLLQKRETGLAVWWLVLDQKMQQAEALWKGNFFNQQPEEICLWKEAKEKANEINSTE